MNSFIHHKMYFRIAKDKLGYAKNREAAFRSWLTESSRWIKQDDIDKSYYEYLETVVTSIIFSALTAESYINYYALSRLTESQIENSISRMSFFKKWIEVPSRITGQSMGVESDAAILLRKLIDNRNKLVHYKSSGNSPQEFYNLSRDFDAKNQDVHLPWLEEAENGVKAVYELIDELAKIDRSVNRADIEWEEDADNWYEALSI
jgi:hypothetical protein